MGDGICQICGSICIMQDLELEYSVLYADTVEDLINIKDEVRALGAMAIGGIAKDINRVHADKIRFVQLVRWLTVDELTSITCNRTFWRGKSLGMSRDDIEHKRKVSDGTKMSTYVKKHHWQDVLAVEYETIESNEHTQSRSGRKRELGEDKRLPGGRVILGLACGHAVTRPQTRYKAGQRIRCGRCAYDKAVKDAGEAGGAREGEGEGKGKSDLYGGGDYGQYEVQFKREKTGNVTVNPEAIRDMKVRVGRLIPQPSIVEPEPDPDPSWYPDYSDYSE